MPWKRWQVTRVINSPDSMAGFFANFEAVYKLHTGYFTEWSHCKKSSNIIDLTLLFHSVGWWVEIGQYVVLRLHPGSSMQQMVSRY